MDRKNENKDQTPPLKPAKVENGKQHSSAFRETHRGDQKSTSNIEEEVELEQQRKQAMTGRD